MKILKYIAVCILTLTFIIVPYQITIGNNNNQENANNCNIFTKILKHELNIQASKETSVPTISHNIGLGEFIISSILPKSSNTNFSSNHYEIKYDLNKLNETSTNDGNPKVVIYHTHTTESYYDSENPDVYRNNDPSNNMIQIGSIVSKILHDEYNIDVIHIKDVFDVPYTGAYYRSEDALLEVYAQNPGIIYAFDIHRDGLNPSDENRNAYLADINDTDCAKVMIVLGLKSDYAEANVELAYKVADQMEIMYPGMFKRIVERNSDYNQYIAPKSLLFEVGSNLSTKQEAMNTAVYLGRVVGEIITKEQNQE